MFKPSRQKIIILTLFSIFAQGIFFINLWIAAKLLDIIAYQPSETFQYFIKFLIFYFIFKVLDALSNATDEWYKNWAIISEYKRGWEFYFPDFIPRRIREYYDNIYNTLQTNIPNLFLILTDIWVKVATFVSLTFFCILQVYKDHFFLGLSIGLSISLLTFFSSFFLENQYKESLKNLNLNNSFLIGWMQRFFHGYKDITANIANIIQKDPQNIMQETLDERVNLMKKHLLIDIKRGLIGFVMVDLPPLLGFVMIFYQGYQGALTIGGVYFWIGLMDRFINLGLSLREIKENYLQYRSLQSVIVEQTAVFRKLKKPPSEQVGNTTETPDRKFQLMDGSSVKLNTKPGLYHIQGGNATGKSTLLDTIVGLNDTYDDWSQEQIQEFIIRIGQSYRTIESNPVILRGVSKDFWQDLTGSHNSTSSKWEDRIKSNLDHGALDTKLRDFWWKKLQYLKEVYSLREGSLSQGEKVLFSTLRMLLSLDMEVKAIFCDEVESVLDEKARKMFQESLYALSNKYAIYFVSHTTKVDCSILNQILFSQVYLIGYNKKHHCSKLFPLIINAVVGSGKVSGSGSIGLALIDCARKVLSTLLAIDVRFMVLKTYHFHLDLDDLNFVTGDPRSSGLALAVGFLNLYRKMTNQSPAEGVAATGDVFLNGIVQVTSQISTKVACAQRSPWIKMVLTPQEVPHLSKLYPLLFES